MTIYGTVPEVPRRCTIRVRMAGGYRYRAEGAHRRGIRLRRAIIPMPRLITVGTGPRRLIRWGGTRHKDTDEILTGASGIRVLAGITGVPRPTIIMPTPYISGRRPYRQAILVVSTGHMGMR